MGRLNRIAVVTFSVCLVAWAAVASAQTSAAQQGPLVLQPLSGGPVIVPDLKWAKFNRGKNGVLVGGYGGWTLDNGLLLGGGVDFLADHNFRDPVASMGYGGLVGGWSMPGDRAVRPGARALVGFGNASLTDSVSFVVPKFPHHHDLARVPAPQPGSTVVQRVRFSEDFFVFEPQAMIALRLARTIGIDLAGGYRVIGGANRFGNNYDSRLRGPSVTVGVRIGPHV